MAYEGPQIPVGWFQASTSFSSTDQYCLVKLSTTVNSPPDVRITDTSGEQAFGVLDDLGAETSGSAVRVVAGYTKVRVSSTHAAITVQAPLFSRDNGTVNVTSSSGFYPVGIALEGLAADTSGIIPAFIWPSFNQRTT